jgi:hypothetical protein
VKRFVFHPFLFATAPILFLYSYNAPRLPISGSELTLPLILALALAALLLLLYRLALRDPRKAGIAASLFLLVSFSYGHVFAALGGRASHAVLLGVSILALGGGTLLVARARTDLRNVTALANAVGATIFLLNLGTGLPSLVRRDAPPGRAPSAPGAAAEAPDIYYIILDGYARADILKDIYGFDNSSFTGWLERNGFRVAARSRSNYAQTYLSLASSLNMTGLDSVAGLDSGSDNRSPLLRLIRNNRVMRELKKRGYTTVSYASGYTGTDLANADIHYAPRWSLSEFQNLVISTTPLPLILDRVLRRSQFDLHRDRILYTLAHLPDAARLKQPVFVFAHILSPHPPFVFGPGGRKINPDGYFTIAEGGSFKVVDKEKVRREYVAHYRDQLEFLTGKVQQTLTRILAESPRPPVIILQGDHGPGSVLNWDDPEPTDLQERMAILNAALFPGDNLFYDSITPQNTFRLVFDRVFGDTLSLLPDRSRFSTVTRPYRFFDVDAPQAYAAVRNAAAAEITIVAFILAEPTEPVNPGLYARRLVGLKYPGETRSVANIYVRHIRAKPEGETASGAFESYRQSVQSGELPDLGDKYDSFEGKGPDGWPVTALFFSESAPAR